MPSRQKANFYGGKMERETVRYWLGFNAVRGIGPVRLRRLIERFGDVRAAWEAPDAALKEAGLDRRSLESLLHARRTLDLDALLRHLQATPFHLLTWEDEGYPASLRELEAPPPVLFVWGTLLPEDRWAAAIVGTRKATTYGREVAYRLAKALARNGITVVSGLARGIDAIAHRAALEGGGRTIAVLGSGLDRIYPAEHRKLAAEIAAHGALISEYPLGTPPEAVNFPPRNRIISGLSRAVVVVEAGVKSGSLITADYAAEQGRDVFAVPGSILSPASAGCNRLLRDGAGVVTEAEDIILALGWERLAEAREAQTVLPETPTEALLLQNLSVEPLHVDELARRCALSAAEVSSTLVVMELKGMVRQVKSMYYVAVI